jgi:hypothetical protein
MGTLIKSSCHTLVTSVGIAGFSKDSQTSLSLAHSLFAPSNTLITTVLRSNTCIVYVVFVVVSDCYPAPQSFCPPVPLS